MGMVLATVKNRYIGCRRTQFARSTYEFNYKAFGYGLLKLEPTKAINIMITHEFTSRAHAYGHKSMVVCVTLWSPTHIVFAITLYMHPRGLYTEEEREKL